MEVDRTVSLLSAFSEGSFDELPKELEQAFEGLLNNPSATTLDALYQVLHTNYSEELPPLPYDLWTSILPILRKLYTVPTNAPEDAATPGSRTAR